MINFCTLFDSNYLARGLALHESLQRTCPAFHLYVVAFDDLCYNYLKQANIPGLTPISLKEFEDEELLRVKPTRSVAEYCWTCTSSVILYCINTYQLPSCTYLDADMIFYEDPQKLIDEMGQNAVLITEHGYTKEYDQSHANGIYCVQFMFFRNDEKGMTALEWWRERCLEWCYAYQEDGKFGDQKYLDDWTTRFEGVHVLQNRGGGVAPWNLQQFVFKKSGGHILLTTVKGQQTLPLVFFHFHGLKFYTNNMVSCCGTLYEIDEPTKSIVYIPYIKRLLQIEETIKQQGTISNPNGRRAAAPGKMKVFAGFCKELLYMFSKGKISPFKVKTYNFSKHYHYYTLDNLQ